MENAGIKKTRASSSEAARQYRQAGHDDALKFAQCIGLSADYKNDPKAKKDVIDPSGDAHSVKSGLKKWQIFLYGLNRFKGDEFFRVMNGMGQLLIDCIRVFPEEYDCYIENKTRYKERLATPMKALSEKLQDKERLKAFISKAMFNGGEVNYLTICEQGKFHVFWGKEVAQVMADNLKVENSKAKTKGQLDNQKVIFKYNNLNLAELEMRNDSATHYREIRFNMIKPRAVKLLFTVISSEMDFNQNVVVHGQAKKHFGHWRK